MPSFPVFLVFCVMELMHCILTNAADYTSCVVACASLMLTLHNSDLKPFTTLSAYFFFYH